MQIQQELSSRKFQKSFSKFGKDFKNFLDRKYSILFIVILGLSLSNNKVFCETFSESGIFNRKQLKSEVRSKYSHIKIYDEDGKRFLCFVRDNGDEVVESKIDLIHPEFLELKYTQAMFGAFLILPKLPKKTLLVGLGGGGMPHFLYHYFPDITMKIVEIDPEILNVSKKFFFLPEKISKNVIIEDIYKHLGTNNESYDMIFMDAFLKPGKETDETGIAFKFKEKAFFELLKSRLLPGGMVVFNINHHNRYKSDLDSISMYFPNTYVVHRKGSGNYILIASTSKEKIDKARRFKMAEWIDLDRNPNFSFKELSNDFLE